VRGEITRRELATGLTVAGSLIAATSVSACSPPPVPDQVREPHRQFFQAMSRRDYSLAEKFVDDASKLVIARDDYLSAFSGKNIIAPLSNLITVEGFRIAGDTDDRVFGGFWSSEYPWEISNFLPNGKIELGNCGTELQSPILSIFCRMKSANKIAQLLIMQSYKMATGFGGGPPLPQWETGANTNG
jgi:hypothetical protein